MSLRPADAVEVRLRYCLSLQGCAEGTVPKNLLIQVKGLEQEDMAGAWSRGVALSVEETKVQVRYLEVCLSSLDNRLWPGKASISKSLSKMNSCFRVN